MKRNNDSSGMADRMVLIPLERDYMFSAVMRHRDACIGMLEAIFGRRVSDIAYVDPLDTGDPQVQRHMAFNPANRSVRLDVYFEDSSSVYDIEMQRTDEGDLLKRARLYSSMMDANMLDRGCDEEGMKDSYVIFICTFDPFGLGEKVHWLRTMDWRHADLPIPDGRNIIFLNTKGTKGALNPDIEALFEYMNGGASAIGGESGSPLVRLIDGYVRGLNGDDDWRQGYMKYELDLRRNYRKGVNEGIAEEKRRIAKEMSSNGIAPSVIASCTSLSMDEISRLLED